MGASKRVACRQLREPLAIEDQGPACGYSSPGHAARASARDSSGTGPYLGRKQLGEFGEQVQFELAGHCLSHVLAELPPPDAPLDGRSEILGH